MNRNWLRFLRWHVLRDVTHHPLLAALNVGSIALGVAVYLAIQIANNSANRAFASTIDLVAGKSHLHISSLSSALPEKLLPAVAKARFVAAATPLVRGWLSLPDFPGEYLQVLGLDVFSNEPFRTFEVTTGDGQMFDAAMWLGRRDTIAVAESFAVRHSLQPGDSLRVQVNGATHLMRVGFLLKSQGGPDVDPQFAAMDIGWAQELFAQRGTLSSIQLRLTDIKRRDEAVAELRAQVPGDVVIGTPAQRSEQIEKLLSSFQLNLTAMSMVALLVGMFLIYNTVSASVARRRREIGIFRSLGMSRFGVRALFLSEALIVGSAGILLGLAGGSVLAQRLVGTVSETISSLYVLVKVREAVVSPAMYFSAIGVGLMATMLAAWLPARRAAGMAPVAALAPPGLANKEKLPAVISGQTAAGLLVLGTVFSVVALRFGPAWLGFGAAFCVLAGFSCLAPLLVTFLSRAARRLSFNQGTWQTATMEMRLAALQLKRSTLRNSVTIAAVGAAVAMAVGLNVMVFSFRDTVQTWLRQTLVADLFITTATNEIVGASSFLPSPPMKFFEEHPAVEAVDTYREIELPFREDTVALASIRGSGRRQFDFVQGDPAAIMHRFATEGCVLVSESFARRFGVQAGSDLALPTPEGVRQFQIAGVFYDYTRDRGVVFMQAKTFHLHWHDDRIQSLALYLRAGSAGEAVAEDFKKGFNGGGEFAVYSNRDLRRRVFEIFDQTFAVTQVLRTIAVIVAILGVFLTLTTLVTERSRELAIIRALGGSMGQIRRLIFWESGMIGALSSLLGLVSGICLALVLTWVINRAFFGWTVRLAFPWGSLALTPVWILIAALLASWLPARRAGRVIIADAIRSE